LSSQAAAVQANPSIAGIGQIRIDQPMGEDFPAISLLQRPLQMGRIRRRSQQMNGFHQAVVSLEGHHHGPLDLVFPLLAAAGWGVVEAKKEDLGQLFSSFQRSL
jgi:hypothetical protein